MSQELRNRLREARAKLALSQSLFAQKIGIPLGTLIKWENDQATPRGLALTSINQILDKILAEK